MRHHALLIGLIATLALAAPIAAEAKPHIPPPSWMTECHAPRGWEGWCWLYTSVTECQGEARDGEIFIYPASCKTTYANPCGLDKFKRRRLARVSTAGRDPSCWPS